MDQDRATGKGTLARIVTTMLFGLLLSSTALAARGGNAVAVVNGTEIDRGTLQREVDIWLGSRRMDAGGVFSPSAYKQLEQTVLERLVQEELLLQAARRSGIEIDEATVDQRIEETANAAPGSLIKRQRGALGETAFRARVRRSLMLETYVLEQIQPQVEPPSEAEIQAFYQARAANKAPPTETSRALIRAELQREALAHRIGEHLRQLREQGEVEIHR